MAYQANWITTRAKWISPSRLFGRVSALLRRSKSAVVIELHSIHRLIHNWQADVDFIVHTRSQRQSLAGDLNFVFLDRQEKIFRPNKDYGANFFCRKAFACSKIETLGQLTG